MSMSPANTARLRRGAAGAGSLAVLAALVLGTITAWPQVERQDIALSAEPEASASLLACAGPVLALGRDATAASPTAAAPLAVVGATVAGSADPAEVDLRPVDVIDGPAPTAFSAEPEGGQRADVAASGAAAVDDPDLRGFAASACTPPLMESWLVGGSGLTGAADLVVLANPGQVASRVTLTVYDVDGPTLPDAGADILVPAGTQRVVPLAALALGAQSPVVLVSATQAPVQATLQTSITRTLVPGGLDQTAATAAPSDRQVIPALPVSADPDLTGAGARLRLLAPSDDAEVVVTVSRVDGAAPVGAPTELAATAGVPVEVDLGGLPVGTYRIDVSATAPVVAGAWAATGIGAGEDFTWAAAAEPLTVPSLVAIAAGPSPALGLANDGPDDVTVRVSADAGAADPSEVVVPAGSGAVVAVSPGDVVLLDPSGGAVRAGVAYRGEGAMAAFPVVPADAAAAPVTVRPR